MDPLRDERLMLATAEANSPFNNNRNNSSNSYLVHNTFQAKHHNNNNNNNNNHNTEHNTSETRTNKLSNTSSLSFGFGSASQSLRCKSSYGIQLSPALMQQQQQRRATAKRLSTTVSHQHTPAATRPHSQTVFPSDSLQSADSEFSFIPSKSISMAGRDINTNHLDSYYHTTKNNNNNNVHSQFLIQPNNSRNMLTSSASLVLNSRNININSNSKNKSNHRKQWSSTEKQEKVRSIGFDTPPPIPPHRTHLHHF